MQKRYKVDGMSCGGCAASVTKAILALAPGVQVQVQLDGGLVIVEGAADEAVVKQAVQNAGFGFAGALD